MTRDEAIKTLTAAYPGETDIIIEYIQEEESAVLPEGIDPSLYNFDPFWAEITPEFLLFGFGGYLIGAGN